MGELSILQAHLDSDKGCGYVEVQCTKKCGAKMKRKELEAHLAQRCPLRKIQCQYCHCKDTYQTITTQHYKKCPCYPLPCPNKCGTTGVQRADMDKHRSKCELEPVQCPFHEAGCTVQIVRSEFDAHMSENQQNHLLVLLGAFLETKKELSESRRELGKKLHITTVELLETREELEKMKNTSSHKFLRTGDEVNFCMTNFSLYKQTGKVWHSPPFYFHKSFCLAVYVNGKGDGAGTHMSVELQLSEKERDDGMWGFRAGRKVSVLDIHCISIQMIAQCKEDGKNFSVQGRLCPRCSSDCSSHEEHHVCQSLDYTPISEDKFIDHQSAEQLMLLNDTIALKVKIS